MQKYKIPFNKPFLVGKELFYIAQTVLGNHISGDGVFTKRCHDLLEQKFSAKKILLTTSCTSALEMAAILCDIKPNDEVILPSFTFVSTANAFYLRGAKLVFVDIRPDTLNIDERLIENSISEKTKVIAPMHYAGVGCEMETILQTAKANDIFVVEDAAQGVNAKYKGKYLGTFGDFGTYSFHETKNFICGEGGALVINNEKFFERAEIIREKGTNRSQFFRGEVDKYTWVDIGSSYLPSDILAAFLYAQLEYMDVINTKRLEISQIYYNGLMPLAERGLLELPSSDFFQESNCHMFYILLRDNKTRDRLMEYLRSKGISAVFHYLPLHLSPIGLKMGHTEGGLPITESISGRLLRLPFYYELHDEEQNTVIEEITHFFNKIIAEV